MTRKLALILGLLLVTSAAHADSAETLRAVANRLHAELHGGIRPETSQIGSDPLYCFVFSKSDLQSSRFHAFACVGITTSSGDGIVLGGLQNKRGNLVCQITGDYTGGCLTLVGCGASQTSC